MPNDSFYVPSYSPTLQSFVVSESVPSFSQIPQVVTFYSPSYVGNAAPTEPFLISISPDPASVGQRLILTGVLLEMVKAVIVDGASVGFSITNSTTIVTDGLPLLTQGVKNVYVIY